MVARDVNIAQMSLRVFAVCFSGHGLWRSVHSGTRLAYGQFSHEDLAMINQLLDVQQKY